MTASTTIKKELGRVATALDENISDIEMDRLLSERHDEIEALLEEARQAKARGEIKPLEPLHLFLRRARERYAAR